MDPARSAPERRRSGARALRAEDAGHQVGRRFALDDPLADLREALGVVDLGQRVVQAPGGVGVELAGRLAAEQVAFLGAALLDAFLTAASVSSTR